MKAHVIFSGPSTAGKTSLMTSLAKTEAEYNFTIDRTWTTKSRRPNENDEENMFVGKDEFNRNRSRFLFTFSTFPTYEYGIEKPKPLSDMEIRMRILMPVHAILFRRLVRAPVVFCSISPFSANPENIFKVRDPNLDPEDIKARLSRYQEDLIEARHHADVHFQNTYGLSQATASLRCTLISYIEQM